MRILMRFCDEPPDFWEFWWNSHKSARYDVKWLWRCTLRKMALLRNITSHWKVVFLRKMTCNVWLPMGLRHPVEILTSQLAVMSTDYRAALWEILTCQLAMGWLRFVGSLELQVSFAEYRLFYRALSQKRPIILRSLLSVATPYYVKLL